MFCENASMFHDAFLQLVFSNRQQDTTALPRLSRRSRNVCTVQQYRLFSRRTERAFQPPDTRKATNSIP